MKESDEYRSDWEKIKQLQTSILQGYISLRMTTRRSTSPWVDDYQELLEQETRPDATHSDKYAPMKSKLDEIGVEHFSVANLDISAASTLIQFNLNSFRVKWPTGSVKNYAKCIQDDRNHMEAHTAYDESGFRVMTLSLVSIEHLKRLIDYVERENESYSNPEDSKRYCSFWRAKIREFENGIERRYETLEKSRIDEEDLESDIASIKRSEDQFKAYVDVLTRKYALGEHRGVEGFPRLIRFERAAADAGIDVPCVSLAQYYYSGFEEMSITKDYHLAAYYYSRAYYNSDSRIARMTPEEELCFIDLMSNGYVERHDESEGTKLFEEFSERMGEQFDIGTFERDGLTFHWIRRKPLSRAQTDEQRKEIQKERSIIQLISREMMNMRGRSF